MRHDARRREERPQHGAGRFDWRPGERVDGPLRRVRALAVRGNPPDDEHEHRRARRYREDAQRLNMPWRPRRPAMLSPEQAGSRRTHGHALASGTDGVPSATAADETLAPLLLKFTRRPGAILILRQNLRLMAPSLA